MLKIRIATLCLANDFKPPRHRSDQPKAYAFINGVPNVLNLLPKLVKPLSWWEVFELALDVIPQMFDRIQVWRLCGPRHSVDSIGLEPFLDPGGGVTRGIVLLEDNF